MISWELLLRIVVAAVLGGVIGLERDRRGRPAGLRTHMVVALASATFMVVSIYFIERQAFRTATDVRVDVSHIASSIVMGLGFLGGGAIMRTGLSVIGLTSAAGIWLVGAIGMAAGGGMYELAVFATALGLLSLTLLHKLEMRADRWDPRRVYVTLRSSGNFDEVVACLEGLGAKVALVDTERLLPEARLAATFDVRTPRDVPAQRMLDALVACAGIESTRIERTEP